MEERVDGEVLHTYTATPGVENTLDLSGEAFMTLLNGPHTLTVTATDGHGESDALELTFTKAVHALRITAAVPRMSAAAIAKTVLSVTRQIPPDAAFRVLLTNNANDPEPVWEDATQLVMRGYAYLFSNTAAANGFAYNFIVTASRGPSGLGGYVSAIGGAFE